LFQALEHFDVKADTEIEKIVYDTIDNASSELREISLEVRHHFFIVVTIERTGSGINSYVSLSLYLIHI
jgi:hypothetical protein